MVAHPQFVEGQTLSAADLTLTVDLPQGRMDRHERMLHTWGIAQGLKLVSAPLVGSDGKPYAQITLTAGMAVDPYGRQVVVPADIILSEQDFLEQVVVSPTTTPPPVYPVFVSYQETDAPSQGFTSSSCGSAQSSPRQEGYVVTFGSVGAEVGANDDPTPPAPVDPDRSTLEPFPVLVGYVGWNGKKFTAPTAAGSVLPKFVGVQADEITAQSGTLTIRNSPGASGETALQLQTTNGKSVLQYGTFDSNSNAVNPVLFSVDSQGNVRAAGKIEGALTTGALKIASGVITHGLRIPLPSGVTETQIQSGQALVHTLLSMRSDSLSFPTSPTTSDKWIPLQQEFYVDQDRRVHCVVEWIKITLGTSGSPGVDGLQSDTVATPGVCDYLIVVSNPTS
jgi:hypothetical protein